MLKPLTDLRSLLFHAELQCKNLRLFLVIVLHVSRLVPAEEHGSQHILRCGADGDVRTRVE